MNKELNINNNPLPSIFSKLDYDRIKINWNKKPIEMRLFLSFLKVNVEKSDNHLGYSTGWTLRENKELKLKIGGGIINGKEYLDSLQFGEKLGNSFNNYVNPFFLRDILSKDGLKFFLEYYKEDIENIIEKQQHSVNILKNKLDKEQKELELMLTEKDSL